MSRVCQVTGKRPVSGNNVSHANNRTRRRFLPNMQVVSFLSEALGEHIQVRLSVHAIRSIEKRGGLDAYLLSTSTEKLGKTARVLKRRIRKAAEKRAVAANAEAPAA